VEYVRGRKAHSVILRSGCKPRRENLCETISIVSSTPTRFFTSFIMTCRQFTLPRFLICVRNDTTQMRLPRRADALLGVTLCDVVPCHSEEQRSCDVGISFPLRMTLYKRDSHGRAMPSLGVTCFFVILSGTQWSEESGWGLQARCVIPNECEESVCDYFHCFVVCGDSHVATALLLGVTITVIASRE